MQVEFGTCSKCGSKEVPIVNKTHYLCEKCNYTRLHPDSGTLEEHRRIQQTSFLKKTMLKGNSFKKKGKRLKQQSSQNKIRSEKLRKIYEEIDSEREYQCTGCGNTRNLSHSHLVPVGYDKSLESVKENITYHCLTIGTKKGCHDIWESHDLAQMKKLKDFKENIEKIKKLNINYYNLLTKIYIK